MQNKNQSIFLIVRSRDEIYFQGQVRSFSSANEKGKFDVLVNHANFITLVNQKVTVRMLDGNERDIEMNEGLLRVSKNAAQIFIGFGG